MTVTSVSDDSPNDDSSIKFYVQLQNLPLSASRRDVLEFFNGLVIPEGGILIRGSEAFVIFNKQEDISEALLRDQCMIRRSVIKLSLIRQRELHQILIRKTKRMLIFTPLDCSTVNKEGYPKQSPCESKKIRPTRVYGKNKRSNVKCLAFLPEEIEFPKRAVVGCQETESYEADTKSSADTKRSNANFKSCGEGSKTYDSGRTKRFCKRKIHPTPVMDVEEWNLKYLFETEEFENPQVKKLKMEFLSSCTSA